jgi:hypothetical protein
MYLVHCDGRRGLTLDSRRAATRNDGETHESRKEKTALTFVARDICWISSTHKGDMLGRDGLVDTGSHDSK